MLNLVKQIQKRLIVAIPIVMGASTTPAEVYAMQEIGEVFPLLDVRTPEEVEQMRTERAVHIPLGVVRRRMNELDKDQPFVAFCKISLRGYEAALILKQAGFTSVKVMDGGILMWPHKKIVK